MITRYNYEEYFLLYVDNELSAAERKAVEEFIRQNPDLQEELVTFQQSVLRPENNVFFENKSSLLKQTEENSLINSANYEEYFLLYIDNELDRAAKKDVEKYIHENPSSQNELNLLQQAKLEPDAAIVFKGKEILYKEEKRRPIPIAWMTWMSAAAVALLLVTGFLFYTTQLRHPNQSTASIPVIKSNKKGSSIEKNKKEETAVTQPPVDSFNKKEDVKKQMPAEEIKQENQTQVAQYASNNKKQDKKIDKNKAELASTRLNPERQLKAQVKNIKTVDIVTTDTGNEKEIGKSLVASKLNPDPNSLIAKTDQPDKTAKTNTEASDIIQVAMTDNNVDYIDTDNTSAKKNKLRGIFRRVSRVFEKTTNADDGNKRSVAIGSFQIALK